MRACISLAVFLAGGVLVAADKPQSPTAIDPKAWEALSDALRARADDRQRLTALDTKAKNIALVMPKSGDVLKPTEITTTGELANSPLFGEGAAEKVKTLVNFEKEKLLVFAWKGSGRDAVAGELFTVDKKVFALFRYTPGITFDPHQHFETFILPKDTRTFILSAPALLDEHSEVKEIATRNLKINFPENPDGAAKPEIITSVADLTKSPALKDSAKEIAKQVNFDKEKLVFVAWFGSYSDRFSVDLNVVDEKFILSFVVRPGHAVDHFKHARLFVVPKGVLVENAGGK